MKPIFAEYIWIDGSKPTQTLRSKTRLVQPQHTPTLAMFPDWGFDGSSTQQATGDNSDCLLRPVRFVSDPIRGNDNYLVLCEVLTRDGAAHPSNTRATLRTVLDNGGNTQDATFGFEQEYTLFQANGRPAGWPDTGEPAPQGPYYCGVGAARTAGRDLVEAHQKACIAAGLLLYGVNAEVMLGQWEYQIGYRGFDETADPLKIADHMQFAKWLLERLGEDYGYRISFDNKPVKGDWNGAGCHANFSTKAMRDPLTGATTIQDALARLEQQHDAHIAIYGHKLDERLTGKHETCDIKTFRAGASDRGAAIRIPVATATKGYGYLEDRRPGANSDPYLVTAYLLATVCSIALTPCAMMSR